MEKLKTTSSLSAINAVLLIFPCWLMVFWFRNEIAVTLVYRFIHLSQPTASTIHFFISTFLKISLLLFMLIFILSLVRTWLPAYKVKKFVQDRNPFVSAILAGLAGVITPFCSCSAVPAFIGFLEAGIPLGTTFTFLIASPLVNEIILIMLAGLFGIKVMLLYLLFGLIIAIASGLLIGRLNMERFLPAWLLTFRNEKIPEHFPMTLNDRFTVAFISIKKTVGRIWIFVLAGMITGALLHGYVPENWLKNVLSGANWYNIPLAALAGIPLYACSAAVVPVAFALTDHGISTGTAMTFIMSIAALSLPEFIMLRKIINTRLILVFIAIVFLGIVSMGYLFNWLL
ncbi:MAG TPA: permease [Bacteroidales bacterium]|nr:permease [Bacteroidales bacterium]